MIKGISLTETEDFVSKYDDPSNPTIWKIGILDSIVRAEIRDTITIFEEDRTTGPSGSPRTKLKLNTSDIEKVRFGLKGFKNFCDSQGSPIQLEFEKRPFGGKLVDVIKDDILKMIPEEVIYELAKKIWDKNQLTETEAKNFA